MSSTTNRLSLYKPADDGSEYVDVATDLNANLDKIDAAIGFIPATSSSPPTSTFAGMGRQDTDTGRVYYRDGTNSSWIQVLTASGTYNSDLKMVQGKKIGIGTTTPAAVVDVTHSNNVDSILTYKVTGDSANRLIVNSDGFVFGPGNATLDVELYRSGAGELTVGGDLSVNGDVNVSNSTTVDDLTVGGDLDVNNVVGDLTVQGSVISLGVGGTNRVYKPADQSRTSTVTLADDLDLVLPVVAGCTYHVKVVGMVDAAPASDIRTAWNVPAGTVGLKFCLGPEAAATSRDTVSMRVGVHQPGTTVNYGISSATLASGFVEEGTITVTTSGNMAFQWAQFVTGTTATILCQGSYLEVTRIA